MLEDKELGIVIAESEEEKNWIEIKDNAKKDIANLEKMLWFQREMLKLAESKLVK